MSATTFRTTPSGTRVSSDGFVLDNENEAHPIRHEDVTITGTQLQSLNTTAVTIVSAIAGKGLLPIGWHCRFDHAGGTDFSGNDDIELICGAVVLGEATGAIGGAADLITVGTIVSGAIDLAAPLSVQVKTGDPTGGHATASLTVRVFYAVI